MSENKYTREVTVTILELVPDRDQLPTCSAWLSVGVEQCYYKARYEQNGMPVCGVHMGKPGLLWHPDARKKGKK